MNKRQFSRVLSLWRDGVSEEICVCSIMEMSKSHTEAAIFTTKFYNEVFKGLVKELEETRDELKAFKEAERKLKEEAIRLGYKEDKNV